MLKVRKHDGILYTLLIYWLLIISCAIDYIAGNIMDTVKEKDGIIADIEHTPPSAVLTLQNRVRSDSNFYAFQKFFEAPFQVSINA